jgi:hypothetical protein
MITVDPEFFKIIQKSHSISCVAKIYKTNVDTGETIKITQGNITADNGQRVRRSLNCSMALNSWEDRKLDVVSSRLQVWLGVYNAFNIIWVPVGVFRVDSLARGDYGDISISGTSLEAYVIDNLFEKTQNFAAGTSIITHIKKLVTDSIADAQFETNAEMAAAGVTPVVDHNVTTGFNVDRDRWEAIEMLSYEIQADVYCGPDGKFRIRPKKRLYDAKAIGELKEGTDGVLLTMNTRVSRDDTYNAVLAMGQSAAADTAPVSSFVKDDDLNSPTYYGGPFGKKLHVFESPLLLDEPSCKKQALALLERMKSQVRTVDFSAVPNCAIEPDDVFTIWLNDGSREKHMIGQFTIPIGIGDWTAATVSARIADPMPEP